MKRSTRKIISLLLCIVLLLSGLSVLACAQTCSCPYDPIIYVFGKHELYCADDNGNYLLDENGERILNTANDFDYGAMTKELLPLFAKAYFSHDWTEFSEKFLAYVLPVYEGKGCNGNGDVIDYVHYKNDDVNKLGWFNGTTHGYHMGWNNQFFYDYRESPILVAQKLDAFVQQVKEHTGHDKVTIVSRCQGGCIVTAWLQLYESGEASKYVAAEDMPAVPYESVSKIALLDSCSDGVDSVEEFFSGKLRVDTDALYRLVSMYEIKDLIGGELGEFAELAIDMLKETYGIDLLKGGVGKIYDEFAPSVISPMMRAFYGTCGGNLACVKDHFDEAMDFLYPTAELKEEYAGLIEKATYVNKNITVRNHDILKNAEAAGVKIGVVAEYGFQTPPICPESAYVGDSMTSLANQTMGATCAKVTGKLSEKYIAEQTEKGLGKYISPDKQVDTSTCLFPETTWVVKNLNHGFPECVLVLVVRFLRDDYTVNTSATYPQFLNYTEVLAEDGTLVPLQEVNENDVNWSSLTGMENGEATKTFLEKVIDFVKGIVQFLIDTITDLVVSIKNM